MGGERTAHVCAASAENMDVSIKDRGGMSGARLGKIRSAAPALGHGVVNVDPGRSLPVARPADQPDLIAQRDGRCAPPVDVRRRLGRIPGLKSHGAPSSPPRA